MSNAEKDFLKEARPLAQNLIAYARTAGAAYGITDARVSISVSERQENAVEKGEVSKSVSGLSSQVSVVLYAGDRVLSFAKNTLDETALCDAMMKNMQVIHLVPPNKDKRLLEAGKVYKGPQADFDLYDKNPPTQAQMIDYAKRVEAAALAQPGIKGTRAVSIVKGEGHSLTLATNGLDLCESSTRYTASANVIAEDKNGMQIDGDASVARHFSDMAAPEEVGKTAAKEALAKLSPALPATGAMPIVLSPDAAESFFSSVYSAIRGTAVHRGTTFFKGKIGQQVMSQGITLVDDPSILRGAGSRQVDSAGMETKKIAFIEDGVLKSYNLTMLEARQLGLEPIGRESGTTNSMILPGTKTPEELMSDIKDGIYIKGFNGGTVDVNNGIHSREAYGMLIKNGKITDIPVAGFVVSGNLKDMFMNVAVANDTPKLPNTRHTFAAPTTRINGTTISGK
ncbi:MAG: TldD/PmbA family protein [Alphaproteobacteria bacterium]|nr:TldD/PmbA family protein [Alphaproteobacteria bacterium]